VVGDLLGAATEQLAKAADTQVYFGDGGGLLFDRCGDFSGLATQLMHPASNRVKRIENAARVDDCGFALRQALTHHCSGLPGGVLQRVYLASDLSRRLLRAV